MDTLQNSDFFFVCESFKMFFEKILTVISDPQGVAIQEWLKYKDKLSAKDATPSSIYYYAHSLVVSDSQQEGDLVKIKVQQSRRNSKKVNSPRKITRRNSFGSESPLNKISDGIIPQKEENLALHPQNHHHHHNTDNFTLGNAGYNHSQGNTQTNINGGSFADQVNQYSPWVESDRKKNPSPAKRITTNEIKFIKGLDEVSKISKDTNTKVNEKFETSKKLLLDKVKKCVEQFQKDSTSLDLINDRSFQTQTMLIDPKNKPQQRQQIKRQDSKFIREFSIYKKNNPTAVQGNTTVPAQPSSQNNIDYLKQAPSTQQMQSKGAAGILPSSNNNFLLGNFDFVKSKNTQDLATGTGYGNFGVQGTAGGLTSTGTNYLTSTTQRYPTTTYQANPPLYMPQGQHKSTNSAGTAALLGVTGNMDDKNKHGIDDIVSRILKEQKSKEDNMKKYEQDKMVQDILYKHKINSVPSYTPSTATASPYTTSAGLQLNTTPSYNYQTSITTSNNSTPYMTQSPIKQGIPSLNSLPATSTGSYSTNYGLNSIPSSQK